MRVVQIVAAPETAAFFVFEALMLDQSSAANSFEWKDPEHFSWDVVANLQEFRES